MTPVAARNAKAVLKGLGLAGYKGKTIAIEAYAKGMDFADALHLHSARGATRFATFDRKLARRALPAGSGTRFALGE